MKTYTLKKTEKQCFYCSKRTLSFSKDSIDFMLKTPDLLCKECLENLRARFGVEPKREAGQEG